MKFCDKLIALRKKNNLTQESLAEKLNISRQAVSKWESGTSMPDMEKITLLCKVLNCNLDELIDDSITESTTNTKEKFNFNNYLNDILKFITKAYNMFCNMKFWDKTKCILEFLVLILLFMVFWSILKTAIMTILNPLINLIPSVNATLFVRNILSSILILIGIVFGTIIIIHIFKIRYLDYYVTIEDNNVNSTTIEKPIEENEQKVIKEDNKKVIYEKKKDKIIIRDPKHSNYSFFKGLFNIMIIFLKFLAILFGIPGIVTLVTLAFVLSICLFYLGNGLIFVGFSLILFAMLIINLMVLIVLYRFIINKNHNGKFYLICLFSLILMGVGIAISFVEASQFDIKNSIEETSNMKKTTFDIDINKNVIINFLDDDITDIIIDNNVKGAKIEINYLNNNEYIIKNYFLYHGSETLNVYYFDYVENIFKEYRYFLEMIKNKTIYTNHLIKIKIYVSNSNYNILKNNLKNY